MNIYLRPFEVDDYKLINKWRNDKEIQNLTCTVYSFISEVVDKDWVLEKMKFSTKQVYCAICLSETNEMIGYTCLRDIDNVHQRCEWGGILVGSENARGKNVASSTAKLLFDYAFNSLNMLRIYSAYLESHAISAKLCAKLNFKVEGTFRKHYFKHGKFHNLVHVGLLKEDYYQFNGLAETTAEIGK